MSNQKHIDRLIDSFIEEERNIPSNPFLATRIMGSIENIGRQQKKLILVWQGLAMALSLVLVTALGIKAGSLYKPSTSHPEQTMVMFVNDESMEHFGFYQQTAKE